MRRRENREKENSKLLPSTPISGFIRGIPIMFDAVRVPRVCLPTTDKLPSGRSPSHADLGMPRVSETNQAPPRAIFYGTFRQLLTKGIGLHGPGDCAPHFFH